MRGRTNVGGGNGIFVNGNIDFYTVADGNSITAGDFVSRKVIPSIKQLYSSNVTLNGGEKVGDGLYLFVVNKYLTLIEWNGSDIEIVHSYTSYEVPQYYYEEGTGYIWGIISNPFYHIARFKVENKKIILEEISSDIVAGGNTVLGIYVKENVFIILSDSSTGYITFFCYTMAGDGTVSETSFKKIIPSSNTGSSPSIKILNNCGSRFYAVIKISYGSGSSLKNEILVSVINVSDVENEVYVKNIRNLSAYSTISIATSRVAEKDGKAFFLYSDLGTTVGGVYLCVYNIETENKTEHIVSDSTLLPAGESYRYLEMSGFITNDIFLAKINGKFFLVKYSWLTNSVERVGNIVELDGFYGTGIMEVNQNRVARIGQNSTWFTVDGEILMAGEEQKIIQSYNKEMGSIGLAKNSGKSGDLIAVYVPRR